MAKPAMKGGSKLQQVLNDISKRMESGELKVGFMVGATYADGEPVAHRAFVNEFGEGRTPARPFFRSMIAKESKGWPELLAKAVQHTKYDSQKSLSILGEKMVDQLKTSIIELTDPPNAKMTIEKKGFNKPLVETGHMKDSVDYEVVMKKDSE